MRFGLCCLFKQEKISFRTTTAKALLAMNRRGREQLLGATRIFARQHDLRLSFHSDQFIVLSSPERSPAEQNKILLKGAGR